MAENWSLGSPQRQTWNGWSIQAGNVSSMSSRLSVILIEIWRGVATYDLLGRLPHSFAASHTFGRMCMRAQRDFLWRNSGINWLGIPSGHVQEGTLVVLFLVLNFETVYVASATRAAIHTLGSSEGAWRIPTSVYLKMKVYAQNGICRMGKTMISQWIQRAFPNISYQALWLG